MNCFKNIFQVLGSSNRRHSERGAVFVEGTLALPIFLFLVFISIDIMRVSYTLTSGYHVATKAARWTMLDESLVRNGTLLNRVDSIKTKLTEYAQDHGMKATPGNIKICPISTPNCTTDDPGAAGRYFVIEWKVPVRLFMWSVSHDFTFEAMGRNEGF